MQTIKYKKSNRVKLNKIKGLKDKILPKISAPSLSHAPFMILDKLQSRHYSIIILLK